MIAIFGLFGGFSSRMRLITIIACFRALDREGKSFELEVDGLLAVCIQHEIDHLSGKLFVDYLSSLKRQRIRKKLEKSRRQHDSAEPTADGKHLAL